MLFDEIDQRLVSDQPAKLPQGSHSLGLIPQSTEKLRVKT